MLQLEAKRDEISINLKNMFGDQLTVTIHSTATINELCRVVKQSITTLVSVAPCAYSLIYADKHLAQMNLTLKQYGIQNGATIFYTPRLAFKPTLNQRWLGQDSTPEHIGTPEYKPATMAGGPGDGRRYRSLVKRNQISGNYKSEANRQLFVKTVTGKVITLTLVDESSFTVLSLKKMICDKEGIHPNQQRIVYGGKVLEDNKTLREYNIQDESTLVLIPKMKGGSDKKMDWRNGIMVPHGQQMGTPDIEKKMFAIKVTERTRANKLIVYGNTIKNRLQELTNYNPQQIYNTVSTSGNGVTSTLTKNLETCMTKFKENLLQIKNFEKQTSEFLTVKQKQVLQMPDEFEREGELSKLRFIFKKAVKISSKATLKIKKAMTTLNDHLNYLNEKHGKELYLQKLGDLIPKVQEQFGYAKQYLNGITVQLGLDKWFRVEGRGSNATWLPIHVNDARSKQYKQFWGKGPTSNSSKQMNFSFSQADKNEQNFEQFLKDGMDKISYNQLNTYSDI